MKTIKIEIKLYSYDELSEESKKRAFNDHEMFLRANPSEYEDENGVIKYDNMDLWTQPDIKEYVEDSIDINDYLFFENGKIAHVVHFTGGHEKAGTTEFYFQDKTYII